MIEGPTKAEPVDESSAAYWKTKYERLCLDLHSWGVAEIAVRNFNVMDYMRHWEGRAEKAEAVISQGAARLARSLIWEAFDGGPPQDPETLAKLERSYRAMVDRALDAALTHPE